MHTPLRKITGKEEERQSVSEHPAPQAGAEAVEEFSTSLCHLVFGMLCLAHAKQIIYLHEQVTKMSSAKIKSI